MVFCLFPCFIPRIVVTFFRLCPWLVNNHVRLEAERSNDLASNPACGDQEPAFL